MPVREFLRMPWEARDRYIEVFSNEIKFSTWLKNQIGNDLTEETSTRIQRLFEAQMDCQRMFTSCGWFFDDFDRIEPKNNIACAAHAVLMVRQATRIDLAPKIIPQLENVRSWRTGLTGAQVFMQTLMQYEYPVN